jgi:hypothetical protein
MDDPYVNQFACNVSCHVIELSVIVFLFVTFGLLEIFGMILFKLRIEIIYSVGRVWRYQRGNQKPYIEEEQTTQWPKEKAQKDTQRSTKHTYKIKDRETRTPLKTGGELRCSGRVSSSCSTIGTRCVNIVTNPVISREWGKDGKCLRQVEHIRGHLWHRYSIVVNQVMVATVLFSWLQLYQKEPWVQ